MHITTTTEPAATDLDGVALTRLLQIVSPTLPIGAFAYSQGLEQAVASGWVTSEPGAADWLLGLLENSFATLDLPVLHRLVGAWRDDDDASVQRWSGWLLACRPTRETRAEDRQLGASLARVLEALAIEDARRWASRADVTYAAMFALAAVRFRIPASVALVGYAFAWAEAIVSAAVRLVPLGQSAGQRILARAGDAIPAAAAIALGIEDDDIGAVAHGQAVASALHENLYARLFRS
jgi:urease accessory protein